LNDGDGNESVTGVVATVEAQPATAVERIADGVRRNARVGRLGNGAVRARIVHGCDRDDYQRYDHALAYDTDAGDRTNAEPVPVPVMIVDADEDTDVNSVVPFITVALVFVLAAIWWVRRR